MTDTTGRGLEWPFPKVTSPATARAAERMVFDQLQELAKLLADTYGYVDVVHYFGTNLQHRLTLYTPPGAESYMARKHPNAFQVLQADATTMTPTFCVDGERLAGVGHHTRVEVVEALNSFLPKVRRAYDASALHAQLQELKAFISGTKEGDR